MPSASGPRGHRPLAELQIAQTDTTPPADRLTIEQQLATYAAELTYDMLPREVVDAAKRLLIDALACGYGAIGSPAARIVEETFRKSFGGPQVASVLGRPQLVSAEGAALINGVLVRDLDLNDIYVGKEPSHPSENIPAALAVCEEASRSGRDLIETIVTGYEAQLALNDALAFGERGFFSVTIAGFSVPLMAGKAWRMPREQVLEAIGIASVRQFTLLAITRGPISMMKALPYAHNAMDSLFAARLAGRRLYRSRQCHGLVHQRGAAACARRTAWIFRRAGSASPRSGSSAFRCSSSCRPLPKPASTCTRRHAAASIPSRRSWSRPIRSR